MALQDWDHIGLQWDQRDTCQPEPDGLQKQEQHNDQHLPRLKYWLGDEIPHQSSHGLSLRGDHRDQLPLRSVLKIAAGKTHHPADEFKPKATQKTFGQHTLHGVQPHFQNAIDKDRAQIGKTEGHQQFNLRDLIAPNVNYISLSADSIVDDPLRQFQRGIEKRKGENRKGQQEQLFPAGILPNK